MDTKQNEDDKLQPIKCKYCSNYIIPLTSDWFKCNSCQEKIHSSCLKRLSTPGGIHGDIFFQFTCSDCSMDGTEILTRDKLSWFKIVVLVLHHLGIKASGTAKNGYFHWRIHLMKFIEKNWDILFPKTFKKKKNWYGTISGLLSTYSPYFFRSGKDIGEAGWWKLTSPKLNPSVIAILYEEILKEKQNKTLIDETQILIKILERYIDKSTELYNELISPLHETRNLNCEKYSKLRKLDENNDEIKDKINDKNLLPIIKNDMFNINEEVDKLELHKLLNNDNDFSKYESNKNENLLSNGKQSDFFSTWQKTKKYKFKRKKQELSFLNIDEEELLMQYMNKFDNSFCKRLKRKLIVRNLQRNAHIIPFNIENLLQPSNEIKKNHNKNIPNCYGEGKKITRESNILLRLVTTDPLFSKTERISPFTNRILKPYIRRDENILPPWLQLMLELQYCILKEPVARATIDFCYVAPEHIPVINSLCEHFFWPGIDLTESLQYPDFTCVVLYRKLVIAFAFMVPDVKHNEAYISFIFTLPSWRKCGIATFMIYHLIQTCMGKDITLHVSINNPSIFLYQKFGFKVEEMVLDFYDNYLLDEEKQSKHAFFLRLER